MLLQTRAFVRRALLAGAIAAVFPLAHADITVEENMSVSGAGLMKMANMSGHSVQTVSGNHSRTDSDLQFESGMMRALARGVGPMTEIVKLDEDKIYELNQKKKTYTETTFTERRERMQAAMQKMQDAQASQQQATSGVDEAECEWSDPKAEVKKSGEKATIGGYPAERVVINATQACKSKKTGEVCEFGLSLDQWLAPGFEASEERLSYQRAYAEKLGLTTTSSRDFAERAQQLFGRYKGLWTAVGAKAKEVKGGYPVKSGFALGVGGPQCQSTQQAQANGGPAEAPSIGGALGGALGGMFKKKEPPKPAPTTPGTVPPNGLMSLMTVSSELVSVNRATVAPQQFEVPSDFKKGKD
jgi:hypothetical protein